MILYNKFKGKCVANYDYRRATSVTNDQVHQCCGLFEIKSWGVKHQECIDSTRPFREQLILNEMEYCGICHKHCSSPPDYVLHHEHLHLCAPMFVCAVCQYPYITCTALNMHVTEIHGGPVSVQQQLSFIYNFEP